MPDPDSDLIKNVVSERLKRVDGLVKAQKIDEAVKEIAEIRKLDSKNPYALAYEERIKTLQQDLKSQASPSVNSKTSPLEMRKDEPTPQGTDESAIKIVVNRTPYSVTPGTPVSRIEDSGSQTLSEPPKKSKGKGSILLVDDDALLVQALAEFLEDNRFSTKTCTRADEALAYLKENSPDMVICDVNLETSTFGGFTLHEKMRKFEHLRDVPFIFLSGLNDTAIILAGKELGADDYLTKPVEPEALLSVVKGKLKRYRQIKKNA